MTGAFTDAVRASVTLPIVACLAACGGEATSAREALGDTVVVTSTAPLIADTLLPVEVTRYGRLDGPPEYQFADIHAFAVGPEGDVFVHDRNGGIRRFDAGGDFVERVARAGEGPGEVGYVIAMDVASDGRLAAYDLRAQAIKVFEGDDVRTVRRPDGYPRDRGGGLSFHRDGTLWVGVTPPFPEGAGIRHPRAAFVRLTGDGEYVDTVFTPARLGEDCSTLSEWKHLAGFWEDRREPYVPKAKWALRRDGRLVVGCPRRYAFDLLAADADGAQDAGARSGGVLRFTRPWRPVEVTAEQQDFQARFGRSGPMPDLRPAYAAIHPTDDGRMWVWPTHPDVRVPLPPESVAQFGVTHTWSIAWQGAFDVFDADGRWRAVVRLPHDARYSGYPTEPDVVIRGDTLWAVATDEFDVQYVVRYEVRGLSDAR